MSPTTRRWRGSTAWCSWRWCASTTPPRRPVPPKARIHALGAAPTGAWAGQAGRLAVWGGGVWSFIAPAPGWRAWSIEAAELRVYDDGDWVSATATQHLDGIGIGTAWDATNRLAVASAASLFTNAGAGHQLKVNKAAAGDTASLLFQDGFSGRAEMGLAGSDDFSVKVSPDGSAWFAAMSAARASGIAAFLAGLTIDGKLAYHRGNLIPSAYAACGGTANAITLTSGWSMAAIPTGLQLRFRATAANTGAVTIAVDGLAAVAAKTVTGASLPGGYIRTGVNTAATWDGGNWIVDRQIERGSNANGDYVRYPDGSQLATVIGLYNAGMTSGQTVTGSWTYPAAFLSGATTLALFNCRSTSGANDQAAQRLSAAGSAGASSCDWAIYCATAISTARLDIVAQGRWY